MLKTKKQMNYVVGLTALLIIGIASFSFWNRPIKYAIKEDEFNQYSNYILVREVHYTGTGWAMGGR